MYMRHFKLLRFMIITLLVLSFIFPMAACDNATDPGTDPGTDPATDPVTDPATDPSERDLARPFKTVTSDYYPNGFESLTERERSAYDDIGKAADGFIALFTFAADDLSSTEVSYAYTAYIADHPESKMIISDFDILVNGRTDKVTGGEFTFQFGGRSVEPESYGDMLRLVNITCDGIIDNMPAGLDVKGQYLFLAQSLCSLTESAFAPSSADATLYNALVESAADSEGYAAAYQYLCNRAGLWCVTFRNVDSSGGEISLNRISLDSKTFLVDVYRMDSIDADKYFAMEDAA